MEGNTNNNNSGGSSNDPSSVRGSGRARGRGRTDSSGRSRSSSGRLDSGSRGGRGENNSTNKNRSGRGRGRGGRDSITNHRGGGRGRDNRNSNRDDDDGDVDIVNVTNEINNLTTTTTTTNVAGRGRSNDHNNSRGGRGGRRGGGQRSNNSNERGGGRGDGQRNGNNNNNNRHGTNDHNITDNENNHNNHNNKSTKSQSSKPNNKQKINNNNNNKNNNNIPNDDGVSKNNNNMNNNNNAAANANANSNQETNVKPTTNKNKNNTNSKNTKGGTTSEKKGNASSKTTTTTTAIQTYAPTIPPNQSQQTSNIQYGKGEAITILHVAEKPSIAQAIAKGLVENGTNSILRNKSIPVYEFTTSTKLPFPKAPYGSKYIHKVTSVVGHVFSVDFPKQYQSWESVDPIELFDAPILRTPNKGSVVKHLQDEAKNVHFIVLWMDCDREGENINFEVLDCCMQYMKSSSTDTIPYYDRIYRAYFSAINPSDIRTAYQSLGKPDKNQSLAVDARQELDLKIGVAFSRFQTRFFQGRYGDLDSAVLSYGPCQTPTLGFCVQRHIDIETFKPEPYWVLELCIMKRGRNLKALWSSGRSFNKDRVEQLVKQIMDSNSAVRVDNVIIKEKKQGRPIPMNTVALLKACSKALGIGPHAAMQTAERLYLSGYLSYPRTESTTYPKSFDIVGTLRQQIDDNRWGTYVRELLQSNHHPTPRGGVDMGDHPPITPCRLARVNELSGDMARVYELVVRHFIASVSPDSTWRSTKVTFSIDSLGEKGIFNLSGKELIAPGFLAILMHKEYGNETDREGILDGIDDEEEISIPEFTKGEMVPILNNKAQSSSKVNFVPTEPVWSSVDIKERMTTPPTYLTEAELIGLMEKHGIGTDASIATHIENVQKRNYVAIATGRRLIPSKLGLVLVQGYHQIDSSLVLPQVRSDIESQCNKIALGQASKDAVVRAAIDLFRNKYDVFVKCIDKMDVLFGSSFLKLEDVGKPFTRCGLTRRYLTYIPGPPPRLYNKWTETVYPLPAGGVVKQWTGKHCPVEGCNFELCLYSVGQPERTFPLCPRCFNDVNFALDQENLSSDPIDRADQGKEREIKKMGGKTLVLECPLPDHHPSIDELLVSYDSNAGALILDPHFGPKWRLVATREPTIVHFPQSIAKINILDKKDDEQQCHFIQVEFKAGESPLPDGKVKYTCCYDNDEMLQGMVRVHHGSDRSKPTGRGRGRGRGRGGRGRGDGRSGRGRR